jgi:hypothetical protein
LSTATPTVATDSLNELDRALAAGGVEGLLAALADQFAREDRLHELFDTRLMQARVKLGLLPVGSGPLEELPPAQREQVEQAYLVACQEIGEKMLAQGKLREAWMYLRPTGSNKEMIAAIRAVEVDDDTAEDLIELALQERIDPAYGFELLLTYHGTCNSITVYDSQLGNASKRDQERCAELLVRHLHAELDRNLRAEIKRREGRDPSEMNIAGLVAERDWLFSENNYHIDTTHLNSVVRIGQIVEEPAELSKLVDLCAYGLKLAKQFQFDGDAPFEQTFPTHTLFYTAQLGQDVDKALDFFRQRAETDDQIVIGTGAAETYIVLLQRLGRWSDAIAASAKLLPPGTRTAGFAPTLLDLSKQARDFTTLKALCRERGDLLNYAAALAVEAK